MKRTFSAVSKIARLAATTPCIRRSVVWGSCLCLLLTRSQTQAQSPSDVSEAAWVERHNAYRAEHCAAPLSWDDGLAASAQTAADRCVMEHERGTGLGENLYASTEAAGAAKVV